MGGQQKVTHLPASGPLTQEQEGGGHYDGACAQRYRRSIFSRARGFVPGRARHGPPPSLGRIERGPPPLLGAPSAYGYFGKGGASRMSSTGPTSQFP